MRSTLVEMDFGVNSMVSASQSHGVLGGLTFESTLVVESYAAVYDCALVDSLLSSVCRLMYIPCYIEPTDQDSIVV